MYISNLARYVLDLEPHDLPKAQEKITSIAVSQPDYIAYYEQYAPLVLEEFTATLRVAQAKAPKKKVYAVQLNELDHFKYLSKDEITLITLEDVHRINCAKLIGAYQFIISNIRLPSGNFFAVMNIYLRQIKIAIKGDYTPFLKETNRFEITPLFSALSLERIYNTVSKKYPFKLMQEVITPSATELATFTTAQELTSVVPHYLNNIQKFAIQSFLNAPQGVFQLQGPPGTGKTTTIVALLECLMHQKLRVLVCAPSNKAIQILAERAFDHMPDVPMVMTGVQSKALSKLSPIFFDSWHELYYKKLLSSLQPFEISPTLQEEKLVTYQRLMHWIIEAKKQAKSLISLVNICMRYVPAAFNKQGTLDTLSKCSSDYINILTAIKNEKENELFPSISAAPTSAPSLTPSRDISIAPYLSELLECYEVLTEKIRELSDHLTDAAAPLIQSKLVFCTLNTSGRNFLNRVSPPFDVLIIDEAGQAVEAEALIAFNLAYSAQKALLVGDTRQLPATTLAQTAKASHYEWSMIWRFIEEAKQPFIRLSTQYRMRTAIGHFPAHRYYEGDLHPHESNTSRKRHAESLIPLDGLNLWVNIHGKEQRYDESFYNEEEANAICQLITEIRKVDTISTIGIICFYRSQRLLVEKLLENESTRNANIRPHNTAVSTVDGFQGDEKDIIILSLVRANQTGKIGFLEDFRRLNVAITRAKDALFICGNSQTFCQAENSELQELATYYQEADAIVSLTGALRRIATPHNSSHTAALPSVSALADVRKAAYRPRSTYRHAKKSSIVAQLTNSELYEQAMRYITRMEYEQALKNFSLILEREPQRGDILGQMADCYEAIGNRQTAADLRAMIASSALNLMENTSTTSAFNKQEQDQEAFTDLSHTVSAAAQPRGFTQVKVKRETQTKRLRQARTLSDQGKFSEAEAIYTELHDIDRNNGEILCGFGWCLHKQRKHIEAKRKFELSIQLDRNPLVYQGLIQCHLQLGERNKALDLACECLDYFPWSRTILSLKLKLESQSASNRSTFIQKAALTSQTAAVAMKSPASAISMQAFLPVQIAQEKQINNQTYSQITASAVSAQTAAAPRSSYSLTFKKPTRPNLEAEITLARKLSQDGEVLAAQSMFEDLLTKIPDHPKVLKGLAWCFKIKRQNAQAIPLFEKSLEVMPSPDAYLGLAQCCWFNGEVPKSLMIARQGLKEFPHYHKLKEYVRKFGATSSSATAFYTPYLQGKHITSQTANPDI